MSRVINLPPPFEYEGLNSYVRRIGEANYYKERNWVHRLADLPSNLKLDHLYGDEHLAALSPIVRLDIPTLRSMTIHGYAKYFYCEDGFLLQNAIIDDSANPIWDNAGLNIFVAGKSIRTKVCPKCYESTGAFLIPWLLLPVTACPTHKMLLMDTCSSCGQPLILHEYSCSKCGVHINQMKPIHINNDSAGLTLTKLVWSAIEAHNDCSPNTKEFPFSELSSAYFLQLLWKISNLLLKYDHGNIRFKRDDFFGEPNARGHRKSITLLDVRGVYDAMATTCELLMNWPNNWHQALTRIAFSEADRRAQRRANPEVIKKRHSFACNLHKVTRNVDVWMWLWDSFVQFTNSSSKDNIPSINIWKKYIQFSESRLWESENRGKFHITQKTKNHFQQPPDTQGNIYEDKNLQNARQSNKSSNELLTFENAISYLGISQRHLSSLIEADVIIAESRSAPRSLVKWRFDKSKIDMVIQRILENLPAQYLELPRFSGQVRTNILGSKGIFQLISDR